MNCEDYLRLSWARDNVRIAPVCRLQRVILLCGVQIQVMKVERGDTNRRDFILKWRETRGMYDRIGQTHPEISETDPNSRQIYGNTLQKRRLIGTGNFVACGTLKRK
jgi:hypothetical protein